MQTDDQILEVVSAHKEGKKIQCQSKADLGKWEYCDKPVWAFEILNYRVAPKPLKPRVWEMFLTDDVVLVRTPEFGTPIRVREVLENE